MKKYNWIIAVGGSMADGVFITKVKGTIDQVKKYLMKNIEDNKTECCGNDSEYYEHGTSSIDELYERKTGDEISSIYGYNCYADSHTDYEAIREDLLKKTVEL